MELLKSKLYELEIQKRNELKSESEAEKQSIEWGSQIRNYVFHPYKQVKDLRTEIKSTNLGGVMDGELDEFIKAYLLS